MASLNRRRIQLREPRSTPPRLAEKKKERREARKQGTPYPGEEIAVDQPYSISRGEQGFSSRVISIGLAE